MSSQEPFRCYAIVEVMGHRSFAGLVTEHIVAGKGFVRIDVPEDRTVGYAVVPAYTKIFGTDAIYCISPCSEDAARKCANGGAVWSGAKLLTPPNLAPASEPRKEAENALTDAEPEAADDARMANFVVFDESHVLTPADMDEFAKALGVEPEPPSPSEFRIPAHPIEDAGFVDPIDNQPF